MPPATSSAREQADLLALFTAIARREQSVIQRMLLTTPALAHVTASSGATRQDPKRYFFESIAHYAYAGDTPLHLAAASHDPELATQLLAMKADVHAQNRRGAQPLHYAADAGPGLAKWNPDAQAAVILVLLEAGADANSYDKSGVTPLHRAVRARCAAAVEALITHGAHAQLRNASGSTPLHLAVQNTGRSGSGSDAAKREQAQIIDLLLEHGARPSDENANGKSVLASAAKEWLERLSRT